MFRKMFAAVVVAGALCIPSELSAQAKGDKADEQAKMMSVQFARALLDTKDVDAVMKLVGVPHLYQVVPIVPESGPDVTSKLDDLRKVYAREITRNKLFKVKGPVEILGIRTYEQFLAKEGKDLEPQFRQPFDKVLKKTDRMVRLRLRGDDTNFIDLEGDVLVGWCDGQAKVVGHLLSGFEREGRPVRALDLILISGATRVECFRIDPRTSDKGKGKPNGKKIDGYPITAIAKEQGRDFAVKVTNALKNEKSYGPSARCFFPGVGFRVWKDKDSVDIVICYMCSSFYVVTRNADGREFERTPSAGFQGNWAAFVQLAKEAFPDDAAIQKLETKDSRRVGDGKPGL